MLWNGQPVRRQADWARLRRTSIGIVFQEFNLIPTLTALENVELALFGRGLSSKRRLARAAILLDRVGLEPACIIGSPPSRAASGSASRSRARWPMSRRCCSPTSPPGISTASMRQLVAELLFELRADPAMTIVLVTHNEELAARCPRRVRIKDGDIVEDAGKAFVAPPIASERRAMNLDRSRAAQSPPPADPHLPVDPRHRTCRRQRARPDLAFAQHQGQHA